MTSRNINNSYKRLISIFVLTVLAIVAIDIFDYYFSAHGYEKNATEFYKKLESIDQEAYGGLSELGRKPDFVEEVLEISISIVYAPILLVFLFLSIHMRSKIISASMVVISSIVLTINSYLLYEYFSYVYGGEFTIYNILSIASIVLWFIVLYVSYKLFLLNKNKDIQIYSSQ